ncbi:MAG: DUF1919 domain-containing protein [Lachnospiraceae bacterium]|nr:DUF1919 domain-containing protein [Lachnospiraceae bacterium]
MFPLYARIWNKLIEKTNPIFGRIRQKKLKNRDFTIISNNCWAGVCYEYFALKKLSPTVGLYFYAEDYLKFVSDLKYYTGLTLEMISAEKSKHYAELKKRGELEVPIGKLGDIEVIFLHYKDPKVAKEKWERRVKRINWSNLILKFSYMNGCTDEMVREFEELNVQKKIIFVPKLFSEYDNAFVIPAGNEGQIENDTFYWNRWFDVIEFLNR